MNGEGNKAARGNPDTSDQYVSPSLFVKGLTKLQLTEVISLVLCLVTESHEKITSVSATEVQVYLDEHKDWKHEILVMLWHNLVEQQTENTRNVPIMVSS